MSSLNKNYHVNGMTTNFNDSHKNFRNYKVDDYYKGGFKGNNHKTVYNKLFKTSSRINDKIDDNFMNPNIGFRTFPNKLTQNLDSSQVEGYAKTIIKTQDEVKNDPIDHFKFLTNELCNADYLNNLVDYKYETNKKDAFLKKANFSSSKLKQRSQPKLNQTHSNNLSVKNLGELDIDFTNSKRFTKETKRHTNERNTSMGSIDFAKKAKGIGQFGNKAQRQKHDKETGLTENTKGMISQRSHFISQTNKFQSNNSLRPDYKFNTNSGENTFGQNNTLSGDLKVVNNTTKGDPLNNLDQKLSHQRSIENMDKLLNKGGSRQRDNIEINDYRQTRDALDGSKISKNTHTKFDSKSQFGAFGSREKTETNYGKSKDKIYNHNKNNGNAYNFDNDLKLDKIAQDDDRERLLNLQQDEKTQPFFKVINKVDDINNRQLKEIKYFAQNMIYRRLFDEFSTEINKRKQQAQLANQIKNNQVRVVKNKEGHLKGLKKITRFVGTQITDQNDKIEKLIHDFKSDFNIGNDKNDNPEQKNMMELFKEIVIEQED